MGTGLVHRVVCPFTPQLSLVLINQPRRDGTLSWRWYTAATGEIQTHDLTNASLTILYHTAKSAPNIKTTKDDTKPKQ